MRGRRLGAGKEAAVFEYGPDVLKLYRRPEAKADAFREAATLSLLERTGLPTPSVRAVGRFEGSWGLTMTRAQGAPMAELLIEGRESEVLAAMLDLHRRVHQCPGAGLPSTKERLAGRILSASQLTERERARLLDRLDAMSDDDRLCHGDFHPYNLIGAPGEAIIIDWLDATSGPPAADVCRSYALVWPKLPGFAELYVERYAAEAGLPVAQIMDWLPLVAAGRLSERVPDEEAQLLAWARLVPT